MPRDVAFNQLDQEVVEAQAALLACAAEKPDRWWPAGELRKEAQNGWGGDVMMFALTDLVNRNRLRLNAKLQVRFVPQVPQ